MKLKMRVVFTSALLLLIMTVTGVSAMWTYFYDPAPKENAFDHVLNLFDYPPEEILPGGGAEAPPAGENHFKLIELILNEDKKNYGLNFSNQLHNYLKSDGVLYSNQKVQGGNLKFILDAKNNTHGMYYALEKVSDTVYYAYTFGTDDLEAVGGTDEEILVYRTILEKTDKWRATTTHPGYAPTKSIRALGYSADSNSIPYSIDMAKWHP